MKKIGIIIFAAALAVGLVVANLFSLGQSASKVFNFSFKSGIKGSGNVILEERQLSGFTAVDVGGVFQVEITAQKDFSVEVEADDNLLPMIKTELSGGVLKIESEGKMSPTTPIRIRISAPDIENLEVSGAANVTLNGVRNETLRVDSSGASKIKIGGETERLFVDASGAVKINAGELKALNGTVEASGASDILVNVSGHLEADASGASKILYSGNPTKMNLSDSGASKVAAK